MASDTHTTAFHLDGLYAKGWVAFMCVCVLCACALLQLLFVFVATQGQCHEIAHRTEQVQS